MRTCFFCLTCIGLIYTISLGYSLEISKPDILIQKDEDNILVMLRIDGYLPSSAYIALQNNTLIKIQINISLLRKDTIIFPIYTVITNFSITYRIRYDIISEKYMINDGKKSFFADSIEKIIPSISPNILRLKTAMITNSREMEGIIPNNTKLLFSSSAKVIVSDIKPPLNLILSLGGIYNYETQKAFSEEFTLW